MFVSARRHGSSPLRTLGRWGLVLALLLAAAVPAAAQSSYTVNPPNPEPARWWGEVWGTLEMSPKVVRPGQEVTLTATTWNGGAGEPGFYCSSGAGWRVAGTSHVGINRLSACFDLLDYEPKASQYVKVTVDNYNVSWDADAGPPPTASVARELNPNAGPECYCHVDWWGARSSTAGCSKPIGLFRRGQTFTLRLRAKPAAPAYCGTSGKYYKPMKPWDGPTGFAGNNGPNWW